MSSWTGRPGIPILVYAYQSGTGTVIFIFVFQTAVAPRVRRCAWTDGLIACVRGHRVASVSSGRSWIYKRLEKGNVLTRGAERGRDNSRQVFLEH